MTPEVIPLIIWAKANFISRATAYRLINAGLLPILKIGRRTYIKLEAAKKFLESRPSKNGGGYE